MNPKPEGVTMNAMHELILGGCRSGKSLAAEARAMAWLDGTREAVLIATAEAGDAEMSARIARHRADRARRAPGMTTVEEPRALVEAIAEYSAAHRLVLVDCLTVWLTQLAMPLHGAGLTESGLEREAERLAEVVRTARGPLVLVSNEIGLGVAPISREARVVVDALGRLHQGLAQVCDRVTLMVAGCGLRVKGG